MVIVFQSIEINNFLSLGEDIKIDLESRGFTLIKGENKETPKSQSNGAGKSSIIDAILWTVTGETLRGTTEVVNEKSTKGCSCSLTFTVNGDTYQITRYKSHPDHGNSCHFYCNGELLSDQTKKSQEMISSKIPVMSSEILGSIVLLGQGLPYKFSSLSPIKRKELLETMSGTSPQVEKLRYQVSQISEQTSQEYNKLFQEMTRKESETSAAEKYLAQLQEDLKRSPESIQEEIVELESQITEKQSLSSKVLEQLTPKTEMLNSLSSAHDNLVNYIAKVKAEKENAQRNLEQVSQGTCPTCGRPYDNAAERQQLAAKYQQSLATSQQTEAALGVKLQGIKTQMTSQSAEIRNDESYVNNLNHEVEMTCRQIDNLNQTLQTSQSTQDRITQTETQIKSTRSEVYDLRKGMESVEQTKETIKYIERQISRDFKGYLLQEVIAFLSSRAEHYSQYLFEGRTVKVELNGNKILIDIGGRQYENLSGGERQRVDLCVQFALRDMLITTTGFSCNLLVLDEAFDNLDMQGSNDLNQLVISEFSDVSTVFTVTHHSDISIPYDNTLYVVKDSTGISQVQER